MINNKIWPKKIIPMTNEQQAISDDFVRHWLEILPKQYGIVDRFNHGYVVKTAPTNFLRTLEIGAGNGQHLAYEQLTLEQEEGYVAIDIRKNIITEFKKNYPNIKSLLVDCQKPMPFKDGFFDRILAIHVLEHLPNLPSAIFECYRLCDKNNGHMQVVIPCEGGIAYGLARKLSAQRIFKKRYKQSYEWFIKREHINTPSEIIEELQRYFYIDNSQYYPLRVGGKHINLCIGMSLRPKHD